MAPNRATSASGGGFLAGWLGLLAMLGAVAACAGPVTGSGGGVVGRSGVRVVAAENVWGDIAAQIGGGLVQVTSIITNPNADPHLYEGDPRTAAAVGEATLVIQNGLGYDDFLSKLLAGGGNSHRRVLSVAATLGLSGHQANPHLWYLTARVPEVARAIETALAAADPTETTAFQANLAAFVAGLKPLQDVIGQLKAKYLGVQVGYTERVAGYLVDAAGLVVASPASFAQSIEDGNEPSPRDTATMTALITGHQIKVLLYNSQVTSPITERVRTLAQANGIPVIGVAETIPAGAANFQTWQLGQAHALLSALGG